MYLQSRDAMQAIKSLALQSIPIAITSTYKGILLEEKLTPIKVNPDSIIFRAPKKQICASMRNPTIIHSQLLKQSVRAQLQYIDTHAQEICLTGFTYTGNYWNTRDEQRVEPGNPIYATLVLGAQRFRASLVNLSIHGAGLLVYLGDATGRDLAPKASVELSFKLTEATEMHIAGDIVSTKFLGYSLEQIGVHLRPSRVQETWLENYITRRKMEILDELDRTASVKLNPAVPL